MDTDRYYDVILFVSGLSPQNDFSFHYIDDHVLFENLSYDGIKFFLNRFKNFDIYPKNVSRVGDTFKFNFKVDLIYEEFNNKIKVELPITKCSDCTLNILTALQCLIDVFQGLDFSIEPNQTTIVLSNLNQSNLPTIVSKMRSIQLKPKNIDFSSKSFQLIFSLEDIKLSLGDLKKELKVVAKDKTERGMKRKRASHNESVLSTDEFPTSLESINEYKSPSRKFLHSKTDINSNAEESLTKSTKSFSKGKGVRRKRKKLLFTIRRQRVQSKLIPVKNATSDSSNNSSDISDISDISDDQTNEEKTFPIVKWGKQIDGPTKRSARLIEKKGIVRRKPTVTHQWTRGRKGLMNTTAPSVLVTDICSLSTDLNLTSTTFDSSNQHIRTSIDSAIDSVLNKYCGSKEDSSYPVNEMAGQIESAPITVKLEPIVNSFMSIQNFNPSLPFTSFPSQLIPNNPSYNSTPICNSSNQNEWN